MKYLCLVYQEEKQEANVPRDQIEQAKKDYWAFARGHQEERPPSREQWAKAH